mgnify:CR=1 FL=1
MEVTNLMSSTKEEFAKQRAPKFQIAQAHNLSMRAQWLRDYYFRGADRKWNNEYSSFSTGAKWEDIIFSEIDYYIVPEIYGFMGVKSNGLFGTSLTLMAQELKIDEDFWKLSLPERRIKFFEKVMTEGLPQEIISDADLLAGGRFNTQLSKCLTEKEVKEYQKLKLKARLAKFRYHLEGFGNAGATGGHLIPNYERVVKKGFKDIYEEAKRAYESLSEKDKKGEKGAELRAMIESTLIPKKLAEKYREECLRLAKDAKGARKAELERMAKNLERVPWEPATTFWEGLQSVWLTHMLVMAEESYPGPGTSFGRIDQYLWPLYKKDVLEEKSISRDFAKDIFSSFMFHCNTAYDAQIRVGNQGITAGFGQLITLSGQGPNGEDLTNELTYMILECFEEWYPILEPKPNVRLHRNSPDRLLDVVVDMICKAQGAPFLLNFDERSMAGLALEPIPKEDLWNYGCVGCLENSMCGNDRSGTVNCNPTLPKTIELTLWNGKNQPGFKRIHGDGMLFKQLKDGTQIGPKTGDPEKFNSWDEFFAAWKKQMQFLIKYTTEIYNLSEELRSKFLPTPYLSTLVDGCIEKGHDIRKGPPKYGYVTINGVGFATLVDSLLAIKKLVYEDKKYTIQQIKEALKNDFKGNKEYAIMQALMQNRVPKYGNDDPEADEMAREVMKIWAEETWKYKTPTDYQFRPGMLSWNYWAGSAAALTCATPNGRIGGTFLSNAICPTNGADVKGPTAVTNSVGKALGGKDEKGDYINYLPNGASHTITFNPSILKDEVHKEKFKGFLRGYIENGGTALQINMLDAEMLKDAQLHPQNYRNLLVRITGYNAYFVTVGKELQDEIIAREQHKL